MWPPPACNQKQLRQEKFANLTCESVRDAVLPYCYFCQYYAWNP